MTPWTLTTKALLSALKTSASGLDQKEASRRLAESGPNLIGDKHERNALKIFVSQFSSWLVVILIAAAIISFFMGDRLDALIVLSIIFLSVMFGFIQEYKAATVVKALKKLVTNNAQVRRDGQWQNLPSAQLVIGDIVKLNIGDRVPADLRLIEVDNFQVDESLLTGESQSVTKQTGALSGNKEIYQQINMAFSGSFVSSGTALGCVVATGAKTEIGQTAKMLEDKEPQSDFQKQIANFSRFLLRVVIIMTLFVFGANTLLQHGLFESLLFAVALAVGVTPELLPMIITVTLSQGAMKMAKKKVIVKKLIAVEDFGNIDTLCCDKTGTLTQGKISLSGYVDPQGKANEEVLKLGQLCSSGFASGGQVNANPIDAALWQDQVKIPLAQYTVTDENEFDFTRRLMSVVVKDGQNLNLIAKGSPDSILDRCRYYFNHGQKTALTPKILAELQKQIHAYQLEGTRVIAVASKPVTKKETSLDDENNLALNGWLFFNDPIKASASAALVKFKEQGINIKIMSGDAPELVAHAANAVNLKVAGDKIITGLDLEKISDAELTKIADKYNCFARITPEQKYRLISALNREGHVVGYLGDGINDAPAIKAADVGIAVDSGAEIAKDAADIILLEKNLSILAEGILLGRKTFGNITKYILNTISANYGNMFTVAISSLFLPFIPLLPKQILLTNFISDAPLLTIATDNVDESYIKKPKKWNLKLISNFMFFFGLISSLFDFATILPLMYVWRVSPEVFRTAWFIESSLSEMIVTFAIRTRLPFYRSRPSGWLIGATLVSGSIVIAVTLISSWQKLFEFSRLSPLTYVFIAIVLISYFSLTEFLKHIFFTKFDSLSQA